MAWHVIYDSKSGEARSICETNDLPSAEELTEKGLAVFDAPEGVDARKRPWLAETRTLGAPPTLPIYVDPSDFISAFTHQEWAALKASTNTRVQQYYDQITSRIASINVASPRVEAGFTLLVALSLLTRARADAILADLRTGTFQ